MKKSLLKLVMVSMFVMMFAAPVYANADGGAINHGLAANYGVGTEDPGVNQRSTFVPTEIWDISKSGTYNFAGEANGQTLYTNYKFKGKTSYKITINNNHESKTLTVKCRGVSGTAKVKPGSTGTISISGIKDNKTFYVSFSAPSYFDGTVE